MNLKEKIKVIPARLEGRIFSYRKFRELNDLLLFIKDFERRFEDLSYDNPLFDEYGCVEGIMQQFACFDLSVKERNKDEVMVFFLEDDPRIAINPIITVNTLWFNKKTRKVLDAPPSWFIERHQKEVINKWN